MHTFGRNRQKRSKFGNKRTEVDDIKFHSKKEAKWYLILKERLKHGEIADLKLQVPFTFNINGSVLKHLSGRALKYVCDFTYVEDGKYVVMDVKGVRTPDYKIKAALMKHVNNIEIYEV